MQAQYNSASLDVKHVDIPKDGLPTIGDLESPPLSVYANDSEINGWIRCWILGWSFDLIWEPEDIQYIYTQYI